MSVFEREPYESAAARRLREAAEAADGGVKVTLPLVSGESDAATGRWRITEWGPFGAIREFLRWRKARPWRA